MLVRPSDSYKYYLPKVCVVAYLDERYFFELAFSCIKSSKISEISLVGPKLSHN